MKRFKQLFLGLAMVGSLSLAVSAQRNDDQKKPPPKDPKETPKVEPRDKPPPRPPREGDKPKKPGSGYALVWRDEKNFLA